jgi:phenylpropionate dioxygenase-like ring-hydroxylating dioxygenase large terminal subunit
VDDSVFVEERDAVLFASWAGIGFGKDVPVNGDARPIEFLGMPLLLIRDHDGQVGVFQNTCRHRGMILLSEPKRLRNTVRCPYHSWCYSLKGELKATPHVGGPGKNTHENINQAELGLIRIRSHVWHDVVFVNISGDAPAFETVHAPLLERWQEYDQPMYHGGASSSFKLEVKTNWKLAVENYCESYHLPWVHPGLNSYSRLEDHYDIQLQDHYSGQGTHVYRQLKGKDDQVFPDFDNLCDKWDTGAEYIAVYPNVLLGVHRDHCFAIVLEPVNCSETIEHIELYYAADPESTPEMQDLRDANARQWKEVFVEDLDVVQGMQKGRHGVLFDGGRFSPAMDGPTHNFHHWVAGCVDRYRADH